MIDKLKQLDKKFLYTILGIIILPIILILILVIARGCSHGQTSYKNYETKMVKAGEKYFETRKAMPTSEGQTESVNLKKLVELKYLKETEKALGDSSCEGIVTVQKNGSTIKENEGGYYLYSANLKCKKYSTATLASSIENTAVTSGSGLYNVNGEYIFKGETDESKDQYVNNYIQFFGRDYRIVKIDSDGNLELLRQDQERSSATWDTKYNSVEKKSYGENMYSDSNILKRLITDYNDEKKIKKVAKKYIITKSWCIGGRASNDGSLLKDNDCATKIDNQVIGLIDTTTYATASLDTDCTSIYSRSCRNYNYMREFLEDTWTLTRVSDDTYDVYVMSIGVPEIQRASSTYRYNIVIYISGNISNFTGDGSIDNPYIIK